MILKILLLPIPQFPERTLLSQKLIRRPSLDNSSLIQDNNHVKVTNGVQMMSNSNDRPVCEPLVHKFYHFPFGSCVNV